MKPFIIKNKNIDTVKALDGVFIKEIFGKDNTKIKDISLATGVVAPGHVADGHLHHISKELYFVINGNGLAEVGDETFKIEKGDAVFIPEKTKHGITNNSKSPLEVLTIQYPAYDEGDFYK